MHPIVFDRALLRRRRDRAAARYADFDFLANEMAVRLVERLSDVRRSFATTLVLGCHTGRIAEALPKEQVGEVIQADLSLAMVQKVSGPRLVLDEEQLPFSFDRFDLVIAAGNLHLVNDLPGALVQIRYALKPDGLFLAAFPGGQTLRELRHCLGQAEAQVTQGPVPRVAPFVDVPDAGALMQRAGYALPVVDIETLTVTYGEPMRLLRDLQGMAESGVLAARPRPPLVRGALIEACRLYQDLYADERGRVPATFQLLMLAGWSPGPNQPKPLKPGAGKASLAKILGDKT